MKKVVVVHGWSGSPKLDWIPWLKKELESRKFNVIALKMPNTEKPKIEEWVPFLKNAIPNPNENTYFIGHSIGCQTILRYIQELKIKNKIGGVFLVAGWFHLIGIENEKDSVRIAKPWIETKIDYKKVKSKIKKLSCLFSDDDPYVPVADSKIFKKELNATIIITGKKEHFNIKKEPLILRTFLEMLK